jgi:uncharacterized protein (DUF2225 family)
LGLNSKFKIQNAFRSQMIPCPVCWTGFSNKPI